MGGWHSVAYLGAAVVTRQAHARRPAGQRARPPVRAVPSHGCDSPHAPVYHVSSQDGPNRERATLKSTCGDGNSLHTQIGAALKGKDSHAIGTGAWFGARVAQWDGSLTSAHGLHDTSHECLHLLWTHLTVQFFLQGAHGSSPWQIRVQV